MHYWLRYGGALAVLTAWACGSSSSTPSSSPSPTVIALAVSGTAPVVEQMTQFSAEATYSDGKTQNVTSLAAWSSSNTAVATVSSSGRVTGVAAGEADIKATYQDVSGTRHVSIVVPPCTFSVSPTHFLITWWDAFTCSVNVRASLSTCAWTATTREPPTFIRIVNSSGVGSGRVDFAVGSNPSQNIQSGTLTVAGTTVSVDHQGYQPGPPPDRVSCVGS